MPSDSANDARQGADDADGRTDVHPLVAAFEHAPNGMVVRDLHDRARWVNAAMCELVGYTAEEFLELTPEQLIHAEDLAQVRRRVRALCRGEAGRVQLDVRFVRSDGRPVHTMLHLSVVRDGAGRGQYLVSQVEDVTDRRRAQRELVRRVEFDRSVQALATEFINVPLDRIDAGIVDVLRRVARFVGASRAGVVTIAEDGTLSLTHEWATEGLEPHGRDLAGLDEDLRTSWFGKELSAGRTVYVEDVRRHPGFSGKVIEQALPPGVRSIAVSPLIDSGGLHGVVGFTAARPSPWDDQGMALLEIGREMLSNALERRKTESALRASEGQLRQMADSINQLFWIAQIDPPEMLYVSESIEEIWGVSRESLRGGPGEMAPAVHPDDVSIHLQHYIDAMDSPQDLDFRIFKPGGDLRWLRTRTFPIKNAAGATIRLAGITEDITDRKQAEEDLRHLVAFERVLNDLATMFLNLGVDETDEGIERALGEIVRFGGGDLGYISLLDYSSLRRERGWVWVSDAAAQYREALCRVRVADFPWYREQLEARRTVHVRSMDDYPAAARAERQAAAHVGVRSVVAIPLTVGERVIGHLAVGSIREEMVWNDDTITVLKIAAEMCVSAIERARAEGERLYRSEFERLIAHLATAFVNLPANEVDHGIGLALAELGRFAGVERAFIFELSEDGKTTSNTHEWVADGVQSQIDRLQDLPMEVFEWLDSRLSRGQIINVGNVAELPEQAVGEIGYCAELDIASGIAVPMIAPERGAMGFLGFASSTVARAQPDDIVVLLRVAAEMFVNAVLRKRAEETLRRHQAELAHALRLGTMGELATGLAHELNQPLAAISNYARGCERRLEADGELADVEAILSAVRQVSEQALRAGQVIHRLRAHVRKSESRRDWCDVNRLVVGAMELVEGDARQLGVELRVELASEPARVQVDAIQVEQVIHNLVRNALDSVEESGDGPRRVDILVCRVSEDTVEIRVVDTGKGLAPDRLESVFEAFETTKREGLGLGLSIARSIVDTHGGKIWADANPDRGATFTFTLPVPLPVSRSREIEKGKVSYDA